jgi:hypothetical protein
MVKCGQSTDGIHEGKEYSKRRWAKSDTTLFSIGNGRRWEFCYASRLISELLSDLLASLPRTCTIASYVDFISDNLTVIDDFLNQC